MKSLVVVFMCIICCTIAFADITQWMIDMSSYNAGIEVKPDMTFENSSSKIRMIIHRLTIGRYNNVKDADALFSKRSWEAFNSNILFGAYHVAYPSSDGRSQASGFVQAIKDIYVGEKIILALDWEHVCVKWNYEDEKKKSCAQEGVVSPQYVVEFLDEVKQLTGKVPFIYTSNRTISEFRTFLEKNPSVSIELTQYPLWFARYQSKYGYTFPTPEEIAPWTDWAFWQFAEGKGMGPTKRISPRIKDTPIDMNFYNGSRDEIENLFNKYAWNVK